MLAASAEASESWAPPRSSLTTLSNKSRERPGWAAQRTREPAGVLAGEAAAGAESPGRDIPGPSRREGPLLSAREVRQEVGWTLSSTPRHVAGPLAFLPVSYLLPGLSSSCSSSPFHVFLLEGDSWAQ